MIFSKILKGDDKHFPAGATCGKGGQFAPKDSSSEGSPKDKNKKGKAAYAPMLKPKPTSQTGSTSAVPSAEFDAIVKRYDSGEYKCGWVKDGDADYAKAKAVGDTVWSSLSGEARSDLEDYTDNGYNSINRSIASGKPDEEAKNIASALKGKSLGVDLNLSRNMPQKWLFQALGLPSASRADMDSLTDDQLKSCVGKVYREPGLSSTSHEDVADNSIYVSHTGNDSGYAALRIRAAKDVSQGIWIGTHSERGDEHEVLLNEGATYVIRGIQRTKGSSKCSYTVDADLVGFTAEAKK